MQSDPVFSLNINGKVWDNWEAMTFGRTMDRMGGNFTATLSLKPEEGMISSTIRPGLPVKVLIDDQEVLDGYVDAASHSYTDKSADISLAGRDKTGDLVDCAASVNGPFEFTNQKLEKVIDHILKPYGIPLTVDVKTGEAFGRVAIQPGETAFAFIERICRYRAVLPVSDGIGGMVLVKPAQIRSPGQLEYGVNIKAGDVKFDWSQRFSLYVVKGHAEGFDETSADDVAEPEGRASDPQVTRYRPTVIIAEKQGYNQTFKERAVWQRNTHRARGNTASYRVTGWYADADKKKLWTLNTIVRVKDPARTIDRDMLITGLSFERGPSGTTTLIELSAPEAYELIAEKQPSKESGDLMGDE